MSWDIVPNKWQEVDQPDILIVEGVNVLQTGGCRATARRCPSSPIFFDFSVYIDADEAVLREWYVRRWLTLRDTAFTDPKSYFHRYARLSDEEAVATRDRDLGAHQPRQSRGQHPADPAPAPP